MKHPTSIALRADRYGRVDVLLSPLNALIAGMSSVYKPTPSHKFRQGNKSNKDWIYKDDSELLDYWLIGYALGMRGLARLNKYKEILKNGKKALSNSPVLPRGVTRIEGETRSFSSELTGLSERTFTGKEGEEKVLPRRYFLERKIND